MGLCSGKTAKRAGSHLDILESTSWIREVVSSHHKKKGVSKFCSFTFDPHGTWHEEEDHHKITVEFIDGKNSIQVVQWVVRTSLQKNGFAKESDLHREGWVRSTLFKEIQGFLSQSEYKRAKFLINIPSMILYQEKVGATQKEVLVLEDLTHTKMCRLPSSSLIQGGLDLAHMKVVLTSLAQFHAASLAWKYSFTDDSILDLFPNLAKPPPIFGKNKSSLIKKYRKIVKSVKTTKMEMKLDMISDVCERFSNLDSLEIDMCDNLSTVCVGTFSVLDLLFQSSKAFQPDVHIMNTRFSQEGLDKPIEFTPVPICAAITRVGSVTYSTVPRDLAACILTLSSHVVRQHYLLNLLQAYLVVLTSSLDLLGVPWEQIYKGLNFNKFCHRFFQEADYGLSVALLISMSETSEDEVENFPEIKEDHVIKSETDKKVTGIIPLTRTRIEFLHHLLDDIRNFI